MCSQTIWCPFCEIDFEGRVWDSGNCPNCNEGYYWDEQCTEDYSDCWEIICWEKHDGNAG